MKLKSLRFLESLSKKLKKKKKKVVLCHGDFDFLHGGSDPVVRHVSDRN